MDAHLLDGSRVNATLYPISVFGNTITIRKFGKNPWTMPLVLKYNTLDSKLAALIWLCIENEISMIFAGGTASGKTSFLNAASSFIPATNRIVSLEETRELTLPDFLQWVAMVTREPNAEGKGEVTMLDLMVNALRQRPDRVIVGEIRRHEEAETLFEAIHTGHAVYATLHADNANDAIVRLTNPPINIPKIMINGIGAIVVLFRHRRKGIRRVLEFAEVLENGDVNINYRWDIREDKIKKVSEITRLAETLELYAGLSLKEIEEDVEEKARILDWLVKNDVTGVNEVGRIINNYYKNKEKVLYYVNNNLKFDEGILKL
jgi:flagellar protein FlaI